jgi:4'-phosphopantetheinyl transferase
VNKVYSAKIGEFLAEAREQEKFAFLDKNAPFLTDERRRKIQFYRFPDDKVRSMAAYGLLAFALKKAKGIEGLFELSLHEEGKPYLRDHQDIFFNLSHSQNAVACILGDGEVGIDIQEPFDYDEEMAKQFCSEKELAAMRKDNGNCSRIINRLWILKEAYTKYFGKGITVDLKEIDFSSEDMLEKEDCSLYAIEKKDYNLAICVRKGTKFTEKEVYLNKYNYNLYDLFKEN